MIAILVLFALMGWPFFADSFIHFDKVILIWIYLASQVSALAYCLVSLCLRPESLGNIKKLAIGPYHAIIGVVMVLGLILTTLVSAFETGIFRL